MPRTSIKGQVLANLVTEFAEGPTENESKERRMDEKSVGLVVTQEPMQWKVYMDGAMNQKRVWRGASLNLTWKTCRGKVVKARFLSHEQRGRVRSLIGRNVYGSKDGGKIGHNVLGFKAGRRSSEGRIRGKGWENARVFESNQAFVREIWIIRSTTHP